MPGLWLDEESVWKILAFVRTLEAESMPGCGAHQGDGRRGQKIFMEKGACITCHTAGREGGRLGPDLTYIGATRTHRHLRTALIEPNNDIPDRYRAVQVTDARGNQHQGILLNEDGYTLHMMDRQEEIHSFLKEELRHIEHPTESVMPAYGELLDDRELEDLLAYLCTLGEGSKGESR